MITCFAFLALASIQTWLCEVQTAVLIRRTKERPGRSSTTTNFGSSSDNSSAADRTREEYTPQGSTPSNSNASSGTSRSRMFTRAHACRCVCVFSEQLQSAAGGPF
ncbi:hypothetical protein B0H21DRAFT_724461 [Amylocystis lapponica]|nr:hypothetical protein B0H21DRAFT_724461 [Amylocystis lapponica]